MLQQKQPLKLPQIVTVLIGLAIVYTALALVAQLVYGGNTLVQTLLLSLGSAILGSGVAFFLIEMYRFEQARYKLTSIIGAFAGLTIVFVALTLAAQLVFAENLFAYTMLLTTGTAIFAGGLTFLMVELASLRQK
jgi:hypothetical protein